MGDEVRQTYRALKMKGKGDEVPLVLASFLLKQLTRQYMTDPLPSFAWKARFLCLQFGFEMPKCISEYFDEINLALLTLPQDRKRVEQELRRALKVKGNPYHQEQEFFEHAEHARAAIELAEKPEHQVDGRPDWDTIIPKAADARGISEPTVIRALEKYFCYLRVPKQNL